MRHIAQVAIFSQVDHVMAVLGAFQIRILKELRDLDMTIVKSIHWFRGIGVSLKSGIEACLERDPETRGILVMMCDQPFITEDYLDRMVRAFQDHRIVASRYADSVGTPLLLHRDFAKEILASYEHLGPRDILERYSSEVYAIDFLPGSVDINTPGDLIHLRPELPYFERKNEETPPENSIV